METILYPLLGGILIGLASSLMLGGLGRIAGVSGIVARSMKLPEKEHFWSYSFIVGLLVGGILVQILAPHFMTSTVNASTFKIIAAGLLVGLGTRLGSGCTSGHGVCGLARKAKRSFVATIIFIMFGILTVTLEGVIS